MNEITVKFVPSGSDSERDLVWSVKSEIQEKQEKLTQPKSFFDSVYKSSECYIARKNEDEIIGFAVFDTPKYLSMLGVKPSYQSSGLGSYILEMLKDEYDDIFLHARKKNAKAIDFYIKNNFKIHDEITDYYSNGDGAYVLVNDEYSYEQ